MSRTKAATGQLWPSDDQRAEEREAKREAVLSAAAEAFSEAGYHSTTLNDIARRLGVSKPTLYYYAKNKAEMFEAVNQRALNALLAHDEAADGDSVAAQLFGLLRRYTEIVTTDFGRCLVRVVDADLGDRATKNLRHAREEINRRIEDLLARGVAQGEFAPRDVKMAAFLLAGAINWIGHWYDPKGKLTPDAVAGMFIDQFANGLLVRDK